jgi:small subunit ribosomal protein S1
MVARNIINKLGLSEEKIDQQVNEMFSTEDIGFLEKALEKKVDSLVPGNILTGTIVSRLGDDVIVEVGLKSEGIVNANEFDRANDIEPGNQIDVFLEEVDSEGGVIILSKKKADRIKGWQNIINTKKENDIVSGRVTRRIKGGLLVDIGVPVFLPASQVDIRKPGDISRFIGQQIDCKILKIDTENHNIVVSRRKLIEEARRSSKEKLLEEIEVGQLRKGIVKNIADFGVFVDLGGLDGLLHISDLSWGRISHPSEVVHIDQQIECYVISVDKTSEKVSLGLKQKTRNPWENADEKYPVGKRVKGKVVNIMDYGAFIRLEEGVEGLLHISEMSWTKRIVHPSDMLKLDDNIEVAVLDINKAKQEISLGLKQTETNPWTIASQKYPVGTVVTVKVRGLTKFGAFAEIEPGIDGLIHISDLSWTKKYNHPGEILKKDQELKCIVLDVDEQKQRISLGVKQLTEDPWIHAIPEKYIPGQIVKGLVTKLTNFGVFVELEPDLEGLLHISELADHKIEKPQEIVKQNEEIEVKILRVDTDARKIGLSLRRVKWAEEDSQLSQASEPQAAEQEEGPQEIPQAASAEDTEAGTTDGPEGVSTAALDEDDKSRLPEKQGEVQPADIADSEAEATDKEPEGDEPGKEP